MKTRANKAVAKVAFGALALNAAFPALAFAAEAEQEGGISAILPDMAEFIPMLIAFIILWIILAKFGWPMFAGMLEKRENTIREALKKSEEAQIESERVLAEYNKQLADARSVGEAVKADITAQAQTEAADMIAKAKAAIEAEKKQAISELQATVADTSVDVAARLIGEDLTEGEHRAIIERYVKEAGSFNGN